MQKPVDLDSRIGGSGQFGDTVVMRYCTVVACVKRENEIRIGNLQCNDAESDAA
jgi:hypothetical protein